MPVTLPDLNVSQSVANNTSPLIHPKDRILTTVNTTGFPPNPSGGVAPYTFQIVSGYLPTGLYFDTATGVITGSTTDMNRTTGLTGFTLQITATDSLSVVSNVANLIMTWMWTPIPSVVITSPSVLDYGDYVSFKIPINYYNPVQVTNGMMVQTSGLPFVPLIKKFNYWTDEWEYWFEGYVTQTTFGGGVTANNWVIMNPNGNPTTINWNVTLNGGVGSWEGRINNITDTYFDIIVSRSDINAPNLTLNISANEV